MDAREIGRLGRASRGVQEVAKYSLKRRYDSHPAELRRDGYGPSNAQVEYYYGLIEDAIRMNDYRYFYKIMGDLWSNLNHIEPPDGEEPVVRKDDKMILFWAEYEASGRSKPPCFWLWRTGKRFHIRDFFELVVDPNGYDESERYHPLDGWL